MLSIELKWFKRLVPTNPDDPVIKQLIKNISFLKDIQNIFFVKNYFFIFIFVLVPSG
jgi:hypothetical protein